MQQPTRTPESRRRNRRFGFRRWLFPAVVAVIVLAALSDDIPALRDAREQLLHPAAHEARKACHEAALGAAEQPKFARIVAQGEVHATQGAQYVQGVRVGEMGPDGAEVTFAFSCYIDPNGSIVKTHKEPSTTPAN